MGRTVYRGLPLHFGRTGAHRYDAPDGGYGVCYLSFDLATALMESVFHQHRWHRKRHRSVALAEVQARMVRAVGTMHHLVLADLTAPDVMARHFGLNLAQLASRRYRATRRLSAEVHELQSDDGQPAFDGLLYPSRNNYPAACVALFERAAHKVEVLADIDLVDHADWPVFVVAWGIGIVKGVR